ncbi:hypothetical protein BDZ91DRAFT_714242 [Kalaharituber pfeilii]|nr:hypothetical protein BDZ91DRAFT_714242 [Kalaharituber pfeilii]
MRQLQSTPDEFELSGLRPYSSIASLSSYIIYQYTLALQRSFKGRDCECKTRTEG